MINYSTYTATPPNTTFLYPKVRQYSCDDVCIRIVEALEKRNWKVPGIQVKFCDTGSGELKFRHVSHIQSKDCKLWFCRIQEGIAGTRLNNIAAISMIVIPRKELHVYEDWSGPTLHIYTGDDWEKDRESFMVGMNYTNEKCSRYSGGRAAGSIQEFTQYLEGGLLRQIESVEEDAAVELTAEPSMPYPEHVGPFYAKVDWLTYDRILKGKADKSQLHPASRYALLGGGPQFIDSDVENDGSLPEEAYKGFKHCSLIQPALGAFDGFSGDNFAVVRINPKNANHIFIANYEAGSEYKKLCSKANPGNSMLTGEQWKESKRCIGRTFVPIHQYEGNYKRPVVLVGIEKELSLDEVEIVAAKKLPEENEEKVS